MGRLRAACVLAAALALAAAPLPAGEGAAAPEYEALEERDMPAGFSPERNIPGYAAGARTCSLWLPNLMTAEDRPFEVQWNADWFLQSAYLYNHGAARALGSLGIAAYTDKGNPRRVDCLGMMYEAFGFPAESVEYHYDVDFEDECWGTDQVAASFASQYLADGVPLVAVALRGTFVSREWISNANIADSLLREKRVTEGSVPLLHEGFSRACDVAFASLEAYLDARGISLADARFIVCGHSRGAAVANLLAVRLYEAGAAGERIFAYTLACPNVSRAADVWDGKYGFIWNIVSQEDLIPSIPFVEGWGYRKYGNELTLISSYTCPDYRRYTEEYLPAMNAQFERLMGRPYHPFNNGNFLLYVLSRAVRDFNADIPSFYRGRFPLHKKITETLESSFWVEDEDAPKKAGLFESYLNRRYPGLLDYLGGALVDMHVGENYLSWLLVLEPDVLYSGRDCYILEVSGKADAAVADSTAGRYARIANGTPESLLNPGGHLAVRFLDGTVCMELPGNRDVDVVISSASLCGTPVRCTVRTYRAGNKLQNIARYGRFAVSRRSACMLSVRAEENEPPRIVLMQGAEARALADGNGARRFLFSPEVFAGTGGNLGAGVHAGTPCVYGLAEIATNRPAGCGSLFLAAGLGAKVLLTGGLYAGLEGQWKWAYGAGDGAGWSCIPSAALTLAYQPFKRMQCSAAFGMDWRVAGWNDAAFSSRVQPESPLRWQIGGGVSVYPFFRCSLLF